MGVRWDNILLSQYGRALQASTPEVVRHHSTTKPNPLRPAFTPFSHPPSLCLQNGRGVLPPPPTFEARAALGMVLSCGQCTHKFLGHLSTTIPHPLLPVPSFPPPSLQDGSGVLPPRKFEAGLAALGVVLSAKEHEWVARTAAVRDGSGAIYYRTFCDTFSD